MQKALEAYFSAKPDKPMEMVLAFTAVVNGRVLPYASQFGMQSDCVHPLLW